MEPSTYWWSSTYENIYLELVVNRVATRLDSVDEFLVKLQRTG